MSSIEKEFNTKDKKKGIKLSFKLPSLRSRSSSSPLERSLSAGNEYPERQSNLRKIKEEDDKGEASSDSDDSYDSDAERKKYQQRGGRRRSLSHSNLDDIVRSDDESDKDETKPRGSSVSSLDGKNIPDTPPMSPIGNGLQVPKSCLKLKTRRKSTTMTEVEDILRQVQITHEKKEKGHVRFTPDTVDPTPRDCKYREYCERKLGLNAIYRPNVKHEQHKQHMKQIKKVNLSDYMSSQNKGYKSSASMYASPIGGGMGMM